MTYAAPAHPPPTPQQSSGPKRWVWFVVGIAGGRATAMVTSAQRAL